MRALLVAGMLPFVGAALVGVLGRDRARLAGPLASAVVATCFLLVCRGLTLFLHEPGTLTYPWIPDLGVALSLRADGLSLLFALLISGIGLVVFTYATAYLDESENRPRFFAYLLLFMGAMMGVVLSANLISLFVFWELTSISSFLLIGFWHTRERSRAGALKALVVTSTGGLAMLVGFVMLAIVCGSFEIDQIIARRDLLAASPWATAAAVLVIVGAITKSAQLPFHLWLPSAMEAPTPVSAYLHAATMVKAGLYLVARLGPAFAEVPIWSPTLTALGLATMAWGSWMALRQTDLKAVLAFSTVSQLGLIMSLLAAVEPQASGAGMLHIINHAAFKGALFLLVGIIEHEAHTRDVTRLGPLARQMPATWLLLAIAALSMAGVPPLGGFVSKEMFLEHSLHLPPVLAVVSVVGAALTAAYCFALAVGLGRGRAGGDEPKHAPHDPGIGLLWGPAALVLIAIALGFAPQMLAGALVESATAAATAAPAPHFHLALWHGLNPALAASAGAVLVGILLYATWWQRSEPPAPRLLADRAYDAFLHTLEAGSRRLTDAYMSGLLWRYNAVVLVVLLAGLLAVEISDGLPPLIPWPSRPPLAFEVTVALAAAGAGLATVLARTRLAAILALGASGYTLALMFSTLGAPDLALTQVMVETISTVLFLTVFLFLPAYHGSHERGWRPGHLLISALTAAAAVLLVYEARAYRTATSISQYFLDNSIGEAGGHNVVNVILVDFRGLDTLGEITVLGVAALACYAIIKLGRRPEGAGQP